MSTIIVIMHNASIEWLVRDDLSTYASGRNLLSTANGDYSSLLSNVINHCHDLAYDRNNVHFILRRG